MTKEKKKKLIVVAAAIVVAVAILNIPAVSDVIAMTRMGMIGWVVDMEKIEYEGEKNIGSSHSTLKMRARSQAEPS